MKIFLSQLAHGRTYRYKGYGYNMCRETKKKLLEAIQKTNLDSADLSMYNNGGWD